MGKEDILKAIKNAEKNAAKTLADAETKASAILSDARVKATLTRSMIAGTWGGEAIRFVGQFKAFPASVIMKTLSREKNWCVMVVLQ